MTREIVTSASATETKSDWATPAWFFAFFHARLRFTVDAGAAPYNARLPRYFGPGGVITDALAASWRGERVWCNPPYHEIGRWLVKGPEADVAVFLVPANTDTAWFHDLVVPRAAVVFLRGRLGFDDLTPPEVEGARLLAIYRRRPTAKNAARLRSLLACAGGECVRKFPVLVEASREVGFVPGEPIVPKKNGPGFPSMLAVFDRARVAPGVFATLAVKEIRDAAR